ncbi:MAG: serine protease [Paludibacter sp.]|nr:serine protease [Paludibacter sp.]
MKSKNFLLFITAFFLCNLSFANAQSNSLRGLVAVVRPVYSEPIIDFLTKFSISLKEEGYEHASDQIKSLAKGGFGSGFVYTNPSNGQNYIITNRHVVIQAQYVNVEFMLEDQSIRAFNKCKVVAMDEAHDLAIISLPTESKFEKTLEINTQRPEDGTDVYTAGYPALNKEPSWQLGNGIVSNSNLHIDDIIIGNVGVIQHTAQIDHGSSGGPLLIKSKDTGFQVIGINTLKAKDRENVNIALPSLVILNFINDYFKAPAYSKDMLELQITAFSKVKNDGYKKILPFISYDYISHISVKSFITMINSCDEKIKEEVLNQFNNGFPIEGVRILIAEKISKQLIKKEISLTSIENFSITDPVQVTLNLAGNKTITTWTYQHGQWCLTDFPALKVNAEWNTGISETYGYKSSIIYSHGFGNNPISEINIQRTFYTYFLYLIGFQSSNGLMGVNFGVGGDLPYQIASRTYLVPYLKGFLEMNLPSNLDSTAPGSFGYGFKLGTDIAISLFNKTYLLIGAGIKSKFVLSSMEQSNPALPETNFIMHIGLTF